MADVQGVSTSIRSRSWQACGTLCQMTRKKRTGSKKRDEAIRRAQALVRPYVGPGRSLSEELIAERRAEAAREEARRPQS